VIHVATVHWQDERWIAPQLRFLRNHLPEHRVYAALNGIDPAYGSELFFSEDLDGKHPEKLNRLAEIARKSADPDDLLLFLDGDAFPIADVGPALLDGRPLAAIRRDENAGDCQPHPSFCLTTVGFWFDIGGDWRRGYKWTASTGDQVTDVGGNLLGILRDAGIEWRPLLRSNRVNLDPLFFGIYGDVAYHHGAGFRAPIVRRENLPSQEQRSKEASGGRLDRVPVLGRLERSARFRIADRRHRARLADATESAQELSDQIFHEIETDDRFYRRFTEPGRVHGGS
jgi:hypothetical protein